MKEESNVVLGITEGGREREKEGGQREGERKREGCVVLSMGLCGVVARANRWDICVWGWLGDGNKI